MTDSVLSRVGEGIGLASRGDRTEARRIFAELWRAIGGETGDALQRCAIAHAMADVQDRVCDELVWDLRAMEAVGSLTDAEAAAGGFEEPVAVLLPSLHLNLAECYRKLGDRTRALDEVRQGRIACTALPQSGYATMILEGFDRIVAALVADR